MLRSAAALWITNILVFASWYWRLDAGGPREREQRGVHTDGAFLFPQMTLDQQAKQRQCAKNVGVQASSIICSWLSIAQRARLFTHRPRLVYFLHGPSH